MPFSKPYVLIHCPCRDPLLLERQQVQMRSLFRVEGLEISRIRLSGAYRYTMAGIQISMCMPGLGVGAAFLGMLQMYMRIARDLNPKPYTLGPKP